MLNNRADEYDRTFKLVLSNPGGAVLGAQKEHVVTIVDDDPEPVISIDDVQVVETDSGEKNAIFKFKPSRVSGKEIQFHYETIDEDARATADYVATSGTLSIPPWIREAEVLVPIKGDQEVESDETFYLDLSDPTNCVLQRTRITCTILDDDGWDGDDDHMEDSWEQKIVDADPQDNIRSIHDVLPMDDFDGDGFSNLREFISNADPTDVSEIPGCLADFDGDGDIDGSDLATMAKGFGRLDCYESFCPCDTDWDGEAGSVDLSFFAEDFGRTDCQDLYAAPSYNVGVFYYPWYRSYDMDGQWVHWDECYHCTPPDKISSDYYPLLGAYSSLDPEAVSQHFAWLHESGVGVVITSWWGEGSREDKAVQLLLDTAQQYGLKVAFHIEPHEGRDAETLKGDIDYIYWNYGNHPAFFRTTASTKWFQEGDTGNKGVFFVYAVSNKGYYDFRHGVTVEPDYWKDAIDEIHSLTYDVGNGENLSGALLIACSTDPKWIEQSHFDGLYNYITLQLDETGGFSWANSIPKDTLYIPSVAPGFSAIRMSYPEPSFVLRGNGATYDTQWTSALSGFVKPFMVTITSFNEWHEGTQIEPAAVGVYNKSGEGYLDYGDGMGPYGYLILTQEWVNKLSEWPWPKACPVTVKITTTSDWTWVKLTSGGLFFSPGEVTVRSDDDNITPYTHFDGEKFFLSQNLEAATNGNSVEMEIPISLGFDDGAERLRFDIGRGYLGSTTLVISNEDQSISVSFTWDGINNGDPQNRTSFETPSANFDCSD